MWEFLENSIKTKKHPRISISNYCPVDEKIPLPSYGPTPWLMPMVCSVCTVDLYAVQRVNLGYHLCSLVSTKNCMSNSIYYLSSPLQFFTILIYLLKLIIALTASSTSTAKNTPMIPSLHTYTRNAATDTINSVPNICV